MNDGITENPGDLLEVREKLYEIVGAHGWERTLRVMASCMRLFSEVPTPLPKLSNYTQGMLHGVAAKLDEEAVARMRHVDREAAQGHKI